MKTAKEIDRARGILAKRALTVGLTDIQKSLICGMINAIVWVADGEHASTMERMLSDEPMEAGKDTGPAMKELEEGLMRVRLLAPCGHELSKSKCVGTPNWQNKWKCSECGHVYSR
jgi:hypothetical protein